MFDLSGKTALVTGATQGIGFEIAKLLSEHGAKVFVTGSTSMEKCKSASDKIPNSTPVLINLLNFDDIPKLYKKTGGVDILVLNASIQYKREWNEFTVDEYDKQMNCNVKSSYLMLKQYIPYMQQNGWGRVVTIGSTNQYNNHPQLSIYGMTKVAQYKMVQGVASKFAPYGITINNIAPGAIDTPRNSEALSDEGFKKKVISSIPAGYIGTPKDIAPAVLLMCSDEGRYITGADLVIDGGMSL